MRRPMPKMRSLAAAMAMAAVGAAQAAEDERSYAGVLKGIEAFARYHALAPQAVLGFRLYPRRAQADHVPGLALAIVDGDTRVPIALDAAAGFSVPVRPDLSGPSAVLRTNQPAGSYAWRPDVRTPGLPPNVRRLGDLRLQCKVDLSAGLMDVPQSRANQALLASGAAQACDYRKAFYPVFADRPVFEVTLVSGSRRQALLTLDSLYGLGASPDRLPLLDWAHLRERVVRLPLHDSSWPDDTQVVFDYMELQP